MEMDNSIFAVVNDVLDGEKCDLSEPGSKVLGFMLRHGECDAHINREGFKVRFSWLLKKKPSPYFPELAPEVLSKLMEIGALAKVIAEEDFKISKGVQGTGRYVFKSEAHCVRIIRTEMGLCIRVRRSRHRLKSCITKLYAFYL